jgi:hypothetical protein|tara:strand:+ start:268 stop:474 length:207 start_codon:yes stop_codon:yes gene_type:complete
MNHEELNDAVIVGIIKTLKIMKEVRLEGDNLNDIDFDQVIEIRRRDMMDTSLLECLVEVDDKSNKDLK